MQPISLIQKLSMMLAAGWVLTACVAVGAQDERSDRRDEDTNRQSQDSGQRRDRNEQGDNEGSEEGRFRDHDRVVIRDYYEQEFRGGRCPPGLAKKNNGCLPPGQARQWQRGQPLPRGVDYHELPAALVLQLGQPPSGSHYVRVASDILLLAIGTGLVIDAIEDLSRL